jgi:hypothetical protein
MKHTLKLMLVASMAVSLFACEKDNNKYKGGRYYGSAQNLGNGTVRSFVDMDASGKPHQLGVAISEATMNSLPTGHSEGDDHDELEFALDIPSQALSSTPFKFISFGYNPHGHEPEGVYTVPHFDFHFYKTTNAEKMAIMPGDPKLEILPNPAYIPANWFPAGGVPFMGNHWIDPQAPELNGQPFTTTFLYGSYDGKVTFMEPMITVDYIKGTEIRELPIKQPLKYAPAGNYPTSYVIRHNHAAKQYEITINDFVARTAD